MTVLDNPPCLSVRVFSLFGPCRLILFKPKESMLSIVCDRKKENHNDAIQITFMPPTTVMRRRRGKPRT